MQQFEAQERAQQDDFIEEEPMQMSDVKESSLRNRKNNSMASEMIEEELAYRGTFNESRD